VTVNQSVPYTADGDAAALSRPKGDPSLTVDGHDTHYRLSLLTDTSWYDAEEFSLRTVENQIEDLVATEDPDAMHRAWLTSEVARGFNEAVFYPYTSLKYHTLLVAALVDLYRHDIRFGDFQLVVDDPGTIVPHRTIYAGDRFALRLAPKDSGAGAAVPARPYRSWASTWNRLPTHPLDTADDRFDMTLDAHLRRIRSWSTALQYIEDFQTWRGDYE